MGQDLAQIRYQHRSVLVFVEHFEYLDNAFVVIYASLPFPVFTCLCFLQRKGYIDYILEAQRRFVGRHPLYDSVKVVIQSGNANSPHDQHGFALRDLPITIRVQDCKIVFQFLQLGKSACRITYFLGRQHRIHFL